HRIEIERQLDVVDQEYRRSIVFASDCDDLFVAHAEEKRRDRRGAAGRQSRIVRPGCGADARQERGCVRRARMPRREWPASSGLVQYSTKPALRAWAASEGSAFAETPAHGISLVSGCARSSWNKVKPSVSGSRMSSRIRSGWHAAASTRAVAPSGAVKSF